MKDHEFYQKYANLPLEKRFIYISFENFGLMTASDIYHRVKEIDDRTRNDLIEKQKLIRGFEEFISTVKK